MFQEQKLREGNTHAGDGPNEVLESSRGEEGNCMKWRVVRVLPEMSEPKNVRGVVTTEIT